MRVVIIVTLISLMLTSVQAQDVAPVDSIAAITTYTPCVGDKLVFDYMKNIRSEVVSTIASIDTRVGAVTAKLFITSAPYRNRNRIISRNSIKRTVIWFPSQDFIKTNFIGISTEKEVLRIGNFNIETIRVDSENKSFWFSVGADGATRYPELIRAVRGNQVLVNLRQIIRPEKK